MFRSVDAFIYKFFTFSIRQICSYFKSFLTDFVVVLMLKTSVTSLLTGDGIDDDDNSGVAYLTFSKRNVNDLCFISQSLSYKTCTSSLF